jgi:hypothetical protein
MARDLLSSRQSKKPSPFSPKPGSAPRLADVTIDRLRSALDRRNVISALNRLKASYRLRVVK